MSDEQKTAQLLAAFRNLRDCACECDLENRYEYLEWLAECITLSYAAESDPTICRYDEYQACLVWITKEE